MTSPWPNPPQIPRTTGDPTGLRYDRGDLEDAPAATELPAGIDGFTITGRGTEQPGDVPAATEQPGDAPAATEQPGDAPVLVMPAFNLRQLRERHVTAADLERGAA